MVFHKVRVLIQIRHPIVSNESWQAFLVNLDYSLRLRQHHLCHYPIIPIPLFFKKINYDFFKPKIFKSKLLSQTNVLPCRYTTKFKYVTFFNNNIKVGYINKISTSEYNNEIYLKDTMILTSNPAIKSNQTY